MLDLIEVQTGTNLEDLMVTYSRAMVSLFQMSYWTQANLSLVYLHSFSSLGIKQSCDIVNMKGHSAQIISCCNRTVAPCQRC